MSELAAENEPFFQQFHALTSARLQLRQIRPSDANALFAILSDPDVTRYYGHPTYTDLAHVEKLIQLIQHNFAERRGLRWGIDYQSQPDQLIGSCAISEWKPHFRCATLSYELHQAHWGQGIMSEAVTAVLQFAFSQMPLNRIEARVMVQNVASVALLRKVGFKREVQLQPGDGRKPNPNPHIQHYVLHRQTFLANPNYSSNDSAKNQLINLASAQGANA